MFSYSEHINHLKVSVLTATYCKEKLLRWGLRETLIYGDSNKSLGTILILFAFSKITVLGLPQESMTYIATGSWPL